MQQTQTSGTELTVLPVAERAALVLNSTATKKHLAELVANSKNILTVTSTDERMEAHRAGMALKKARTTIKDTGKTAREDAQAFSKAVIAEENALIAIIQPEEDRVLSLRDKFDADAAARKTEADRIERERVTGIKAKIAGLLNLPATSYRDTAAELRATLDDLAVFEINEADFAEFAGEAAEAKAQALTGLTELHAKAEAAEAEAAKLEAERAELQRIQAAALLAQQEEEARQAAENARLKAERDAFEEERRQFMAERAKAQAERDAAEAAQQEADKLARDHAEALAQNAQFDLGSEIAADLLAAAHGEALAINAAGHYYSATTFKDNGEPIRCNPDGTRSIFCDLNDDIEETPDSVTAAPFAVLPSINDDLKAGIEMLCTVVHNLRALGLDNEDILVAVGEALEAIDAREAA